MRTFFIIVVLIVAYYLLKMQGVNPLAPIASAISTATGGAVNLSPTSAILNMPCTLQRDDAFFESITMEALTSTGGDAGPKFQQAEHDWIKGDLIRGQLTVSTAALIGAGCSGYDTSGAGEISLANQSASYAAKGAGLAGALAGAGSSFAKAVPLIGSAIGIVTGIFDAFTAAHAAKVQLEQQIICGLVKPINQSLTQIDNQLYHNKITLQIALDELASIMPAVQLQIAPLVKSSGCNSECAISRAVNAQVMMRELLYQQCPSAVTQLANVA